MVSLIDYKQKTAINETEILDMPGVDPTLLPSRLAPSFRLFACGLALICDAPRDAMAARASLLTLAACWDLFAGSPLISRRPSGHSSCATRWTRYKSSASSTIVRRFCPQLSRCCDQCCSQRKSRSSPQATKVSIQPTPSPVTFHPDAAIQSSVLTA